MQFSQTTLRFSIYYLDLIPNRISLIFLTSSNIPHVSFISHLIIDNVCCSLIMFPTYFLDLIRERIMHAPSFNFLILLQGYLSLICTSFLRRHYMVLHLVLVLYNNGDLDLIPKIVIWNVISLNMICHMNLFYFIMLKFTNLTLCLCPQMFSVP